MKALWGFLKRYWWRVLLYEVLRFTISVYVRGTAKAVEWAREREAAHERVRKSPGQIRIGMTRDGQKAISGFFPIDPETGLIQIGDHEYISPEVLRKAIAVSPGLSVSWMTTRDAR